MVAMCLLLLNRTYYGKEFMKEFVHSLSTPKYDYCEDGVLYQIEAGDSTTVVVGGLRNMSLKIGALTQYKGTHRRTRAIAPRAFYKTPHLQALHIPEGIEEIGDSALWKSGVVTIKLPQSITHIGREAFAYNETLHHLYFPEGIKVIPAGVAHHAEFLTHLVLPNSVKKLEIDAFAYATRLLSVKLPEGLETIERGVFWKCRAIQEITIPATVKSIEEYAFYHCDILHSIVLEGTTPPAIFNAFPKHINATFYVPEEAIETYKSTHDWSGYKFKSIKEYVPLTREELESVIYEEDIKE